MTTTTGATLPHRYRLESGSFIVLCPTHKAETDENHPLVSLADEGEVTEPCEGCGDSNGVA